MTDQQTALNKLRQDLESTEGRLLPEEIMALGRARAKALSAHTDLFRHGFYPGMALLALLIAAASLFDKSFYTPVGSEQFNPTSASFEPATQANTSSETWSYDENEDLDVYYWLAESSEELNDLYGWNYSQ